MLEDDSLNEAILELFKMPVPPDLRLLSLLCEISENIELFGERWSESTLSDAKVLDQDISIYQATHNKDNMIHDVVTSFYKRWDKITKRIDAHE